MPEQCVPTVEREPEVLAAPAGTDDGAAFECGDEVLRTPGMATDRPRMEHLDC
jgi:hypothetical protein